jgi:hypothetical protein
MKHSPNYSTDDLTTIEIAALRQATDIFEKPAIPSTAPLHSAQSDLDHKKQMNALLHDAIRLNQFDIVIKLTKDHADLVDFSVILRFLEKCYVNLCETKVLSDETRIKRTQTLLAIIANTTLIFESSADKITIQRENALKVRAAPCTPEFIIATDKEMAFYRTKMILRLFVSLNSPEKELFFPNRAVFFPLFKMHGMHDCAEWAVATDDTQNEKRLVVAANLLESELQDRKNISSYVKQYQLYSPARPATQTHLDYLLSAFDRGTYIPEYGSQDRNSGREIRRALSAFKWISDNALTVQAPITIEAVRLYSARQPKAIKQHAECYERNRHRLLKQLTELRALETALKTPADTTPDNTATEAELVQKNQERAALIDFIASSEIRKFEKKLRDLDAAYETEKALHANTHAASL